MVAGDKRGLQEMGRKVRNTKLYINLYINTYKYFYCWFSEFG